MELAKVMNCTDVIPTAMTHVIENMQSFTIAGGACEWVMTLWDYNLHEINTVRELAKDLVVIG